MWSYRACEPPRASRLNPVSVNSPKSANRSRVTHTLTMGEWTNDIGLILKDRFRARRLEHDAGSCHRDWSGGTGRQQPEAARRTPALGLIDGQVLFQGKREPGAAREREVLRGREH